MACDPTNRGFNAGAGTARTCGEARTSQVVLDDTSLDAVDFSYNPTWGRLDALMNPSVGNHEYKRGTDVYGAMCPSSNDTAQSYFNHFGAAAHPETGGHFSLPGAVAPDRAQRQLQHALERRMRRRKRADRLAQA